MPHDVNHPAASPDAAVVTHRTRDWLVRAVIGLNLCPFAKTVHGHGRIRYAVSAARDSFVLREDLVRELERLRDTPEHEIETTLLIHPLVLGDFLDYNEFLGEADDVLETLHLDGVIQVASFHPDYCFADAAPDDPGNNSNRSPYPMLHLLRESSVARAVAAFPDAARIYERNIATLRRLGPEGWRALWETVGPDDSL